MANFDLRLSTADVGEAAWDSLVQEMVGQDGLAGVEIGSPCSVTFCGATGNSCSGCDSGCAPDHGDTIDPDPCA
jgi:hypothetical protein